MLRTDDRWRKLTNSLLLDLVIRLCVSGDLCDARRLMNLAESNISETRKYKYRGNREFCLLSQI
jgi:hypothetical protein